MKFSKLHGAGNDFIIFKESEVLGANRNELAIKVCDRHFGIGSDGMMIADKVDADINADVKMSFYNADGTSGLMCGNGIRCFAKFVYESQIVEKESFLVQTGAGILKADLFLEDFVVNRVKINLGKPILDSKQLGLKTTEKEYLHKPTQIDNVVYDMSILAVGAMHAVIAVDDVEDIDLVKVGYEVENSEIFADKSNVNICQRINDEELIVHTWEKGVGLTLACGTGCASSAFVTSMQGGLSKNVSVKTKGGILSFEFIDECIYMTGPAVKVCDGDYLK